MTLPRTRPERLIDEFVSRGLVVLAPEDTGIPDDVHSRIHQRERQAFAEKERIDATLIPEILSVINAPGVRAACDQLVGPNWAIVPFTHNTPFASGAYDQHWHKDDVGPFNARRQRHHHAVHIELLYYPQPVTPEMGPTATVPYSQYWTFDHEENHDNFAGADHLDFNYQIESMERVPVSGPKSSYSPHEIVAGQTAHDERMRAAVAETAWPLQAPFEVAPLRAGSVVLLSHNLIHRGNHRRDDWRTWKTNPRFMWRFWLYRTTQPTHRTAPTPDPEWTGVDPLTGVDVNEADAATITTWRHHARWLMTGSTTQAGDAAPDVVADDLAGRLKATGTEAEPQRIGAAYALAACADTTRAMAVLGDALHDERESVRRAATYGLIASGERATRTLFNAAESPVKWIRKAGVFGLGETGTLTSAVVDRLAQRLCDDPSVYVRSVAATALGAAGRRAVGQTASAELVPAIIDALLDALAREPNRLSMDRAQRRGIKFVRPTDECDVCEGIGINYGAERFERVRSAVRENALTSLVVLCSHGIAATGDRFNRLTDTLADIVRTERNVFAFGLALDALSRLAHLHPGTPGTARQRRTLTRTVDALRRDAPLLCLESMSRSDPPTVDATAPAT